MSVLFCRNLSQIQLQGIDFGKNSMKKAIMTNEEMWTMLFVFE